MEKTVFFILFFGGIIAGVFGSESDGIFTWKVGKFEVNMLVETQREGNASILVGANDGILSRYIPSIGFMHTANAFLVKASGKNILIDTGTGFNGVIIEKLKKLGAAPEKINVVLITHLHGDHFGGLHNNGKANFPKAKVYVSKAEYNYFTNTNKNEAAVLALAAYGKNVITFDPGALASNLKPLLPGITAFANYGHTPGHTVFLIENGTDKLIVGGDFLHIALVQFAEPDISASYDMDPVAAAASRRQILDYAAKNKIPIGGMHVVYPGIGMVESLGSGYSFKPLE
ncbi:MAG: MBL fold metallo-hydrolase [Treponema sp.]|nr:MBL fold metallo-hydrolase [Treponema sp.]